MYIFKPPILLHNHAAGNTFPNLSIYARAWDIEVAQRLRSMGVTYAIPETMASGLQLAGDLLRASGVSPEEAVRLIDEARDEKQRKIAKPPRPDRPTGFKDILLVLTSGADEAAAFDHRELVHATLGHAEEGLPAVVAGPDRDIARDVAFDFWTAH